MEKGIPPLKIIAANLSVYGIAHAVVDGICAASLFFAYRNHPVEIAEFAGWVILYNALAFGLQPLFGLASDRLKSPRAAAALGYALTGVASVCCPYSLSAVAVFAGLGNALFHVGGGSICLNLTPRKAAAPGVFVATGAIGLFAGTMLGKAGLFSAWPALAALAALCLAMLVIRKPEMDYRQEGAERKEYGIFSAILLLMLFAVAVRALVGSVLVFPWKSDLALAITLIAGVALGKGLGGILGDRFGWRRVAVGGMILSIPCLFFGGSLPILGIVGIFLFNVTMPITLTAVANIFPGRPGFAFGLTTLALIIGSAPAFFPIKHVFGNPYVVAVSIVVSAFALYYGLKRYASYSSHLEN
jgi:MFS transporter, FSR family, fosmidomycin resistance protein